LAPRLLYHPSAKSLKKENKMSKSLERWMSNTRMNPFRDLTQVEDSFERLFNEMFKSVKRSEQKDMENLPACDISEDQTKYILKFDLPGVPKENVKVEINNDQLTIRAERKEEKVTDDKKKHLSEVYYGSYFRSFTLPGSVDEKKVDAKFSDGVLTVTVAKTELPTVKQIPVQ